MNRIETIGKKELIFLGEEMDKVLAELGNKYGVRLETGNSTYDRGGTFGKYKVDVNLIDDGGNIQTEASATYLLMCEDQCDMQSRERGEAPEHIFKAEWLFKSFPIITDKKSGKGGTYKVIGWSNRSRNYPLIAEEVGTGNTVKFRESVAQQLNQGGTHEPNSKS